MLLVWVQGSPFHIAAGHTLYRKPGGHKIVCTGVKFKEESVGMVLDNIEATFQFDSCTNYLVTPQAS